MSNGQTEGQSWWEEEDAASAAGDQPPEPNAPPDAAPDAPPRSPRTPASTALALLLLGSFVWLVYQGPLLPGDPTTLFFWQQLLLGPAISQRLIPAWAVEPAAVLQQGEAWRLFTSLGINVGALWVFFAFSSMRRSGGAVEQLGGGAMVISVVVASGALGGLVFCLVSDGGAFSMGVWPSVFGLLGALTGIGLRHRRRLPPGFASGLMVDVAFSLAFIVFLRWALVPGQGLVGAALACSDLAGGLAAGAVLGFILPCPGFSPGPRRPSSLASSLTCVALILATSYTFRPWLTPTTFESLQARNRSGAFDATGSLTSFRLDTAGLTIDAPGSWQLDTGQASRRRDGSYSFHWLSTGWPPLQLHYRSRGPFDAADTLVQRHARGLREQPGVSDFVVLHEGALDATLPAWSIRVACRLQGRDAQVAIYVLLGEKQVLTLTFIDPDAADDPEVTRFQDQVAASVKELGR